MNLNPVTRTVTVTVPVTVPGVTVTVQPRHAARPGPGPDSEPASRSESDDRLSPAGPPAGRRAPGRVTVTGAAVAPAGGPCQALAASLSLSPG